MKKFALVFMLSVMLLSACSPTATAATATPTDIPTESTAPTATAQVAATLTKTPRPTGPTPTDAPTPTPPDIPAMTGKIPAHRLVLDESNVGIDMKRVNIYGTGKLQDIAFSPDGKFLAAATGRGIYLYDGVTFEQSGFIDVNNSVAVIAFSPDGLVLAAAVDGKVSLWNVRSGQRMLDLDGGAVSLEKLAYGKGGHLAAIGTNCRGCGDYDLTMILWDTQTGRQIYSEKDIWYPTEALAFTTDGKKLAFGGKDGLSIIETDSGKQIPIIDEYQTSRFRTLNFIFGKDDLNLFITNIDETGQGKIFDLSTHQTQAFQTCESYIVHIAEKGVCVNVGGIVFFDLSNGREISSLSLPDLTTYNHQFAVSPKGDSFASTTINYDTYGAQNALDIINIETGLKRKTLLFNEFDSVRTGMAALDGEEKYLAATQDQAGQINLLDLESGANLRTFQPQGSVIKGFAFRPDHQTFAAIDEKDSLILWDIQSQKMIYQTSLPGAVNGPFVFSPNGLDILLAISAKDRIFAFNLLTSASLDFESHEFPYTYQDWSVNDQYHFNSLGNPLVLSYIGSEKRLPVFTDSKTGQSFTLPYEVIPDPDYIETFSMSSDGKYLAFGNATDIFVWDVATLKQVSTLSGHELRSGEGWEGKIRHLAFSPQSDLLVSVGYDGTTRLWNIHSGKELRRLNVCCNAAFTPDGRFLVTAGEGVLRVWGIPTSP